MKILCIKSRGLGDTVLWTSSLQALCDFYPDSTIHLAAPKNYLPLFDLDPRFKKTFAVNENIFSLTKKLRQEKYDLLLNFHASQKTLFISFLTLAKKKLIHHHSRQPKNFFSDDKIYQLGMVNSAIKRDLNVLRTLGWKGESPATKIFLPKTKTLPSARKKILLGVFATRPAKQWRWENYAALIEKLKGKFDFYVLNEKKEIGYSASKLKATFLHTPTLNNLLEQLANFDLYVGTDSGLKHLSIAAGLKTVTLFGPESIGEWHPYDSKKNPTLQVKALCRNKDPHPPEYAWCDKTICPYASHTCLSLITPDQVIKTIETLL
jgi:heptosyltransferase-2